MPILKTALDVSSHQPRDLTPLLEVHRPNKVVVKLYMPWEYISQEFSIAQVESVRAFDPNIEIEGYTFCYEGPSSKDTVNETEKLAGYLAIDTCWMDLENYISSGRNTWPKMPWIRETMQRSADTLPDSGIYTGRWFWVNYLGDPKELGHIKLWNAQYGDPTAPFRSYGLWTKEAMRQWTSTPVDQNIYYEEKEMIRIPEELDKIYQVMQQLRTWGHDLQNPALAEQADKLENAIINIKVVTYRDPTTP